MPSKRAPAGELRSRLRAMPTPPGPAPLRDHWALEPGLVFLTHGTFGACPRTVLEAQARLRAELELDPVRFLSAELEYRLDDARTSIARFVGADPADLAFVPNATAAVNAVLRSIPLRAGDDVVVTDHEYGATRNAAAEVAARAGASIVTAAIPLPVGGPDEVVERVLAALTPRTRLLVLSHVTSPTALVFPVAAIVAAAEARGVPVLVDGAHGPGMVPLDLVRLGASYYAANLHKWVCAPKGAGFIHVRADRQAGVRPVAISHGATDPRPGRSRFHKEFDWTGTVDPTAMLAAPVALTTLERLVPGGWPEVMARNHALAGRARDIVRRALGTEPLAPLSMLGSMAAVELPPGDAPVAGVGIDPLAEQLRSEHGIRVAVTSWESSTRAGGTAARVPPGGPRADGARRFVRVSAQLYNWEPEYQYLATALAADRLQ